MIMLDACNILQSVKGLVPHAYGTVIWIAHWNCSRSEVQPSCVFETFPSQKLYALSTKPAGGESTKAAAFRAFWEAGAPMAGDEGAKGWAAWESSQGLTFQSPADTGLAPSDRGVANSVESVTASHEDKEEKGGWGEWVPLMPETPQEAKSVSSAEGDEAAAAADEVSFGVTQVSIHVMMLCMASALYNHHGCIYRCPSLMPCCLPKAQSATLITAQT